MDAETQTFTAPTCAGYWWAVVHDRWEIVEVAWSNRLNCWFFYEMGAPSCKPVTDWPNQWQGPVTRKDA